MIEATIGLDTYYEIEAQTVEARSPISVDAGKEDGRGDGHAPVERVQP